MLFEKLCIDIIDWLPRLRKGPATLARASCRKFSFDKFWPTPHCNQSLWWEAIHITQYRFVFRKLFIWNVEGRIFFQSRHKWRLELTELKELVCYVSYNALVGLIWFVHIWKYGVTSFSSLLMLQQHCKNISSAAKHCSHTVYFSKHCQFSGWDVIILIPRSVRFPSRGWKVWRTMISTQIVNI